MPQHKFFAETKTRWLILSVFILLALFQSFGSALAQAADAVCAEVKIVIEQKVSLERQAFDAKMVITNGLPDQKLENVKIELRFLDANNNKVSATNDPNAVGSSFFYRTDVVDGITSLDGGIINPKAAANINWLIIPSAGTGGLTPDGAVYYIGASVTYTLNGKTDTVEVSPEAIVVRPQPELVLDYFLPKDVHGDDAFTPEIEPSEPFTLGVRVKNEGSGAARKTKIDTAQPKIVENKQGLLINFQILSGFVGNDAAGKSLLLDFGDIQSGASKIGRWNMVTSLSGKFVEFTSSFTHADSLGGAVTSLVKGVRTHTLIRDVRVDLPGRDTVRDFLAKDSANYRVYESSGLDTEVVDQTASARLAPGASSAALTFNAVAQGFAYARVADVYSGTKTPVRVTRSDGYVVPSDNVWLSKERNENLSWNYYLNLFDANTTGVYSVGFVGQSETASIEGSVFDDRNANGLRDGGEPSVLGLGVNLTGTVAATGASVMATGFTDGEGKFKFDNLQSGAYSLAASVLEGLVDGVALVGNAGGLSEPGKFTGIQLVAGVNAAGYAFSKRASKPASADPEPDADISIEMGAAPASIKKSETSTITVTARNAGPATAASVVANLNVPAGLTVVTSTPTVGSYVAGKWNLGDLAKDAVATLSLKVQPASDTSAKEFSIAANIGSSTRDSVSTNNSASTLIKVADTDRIKAAQTLDQGLRVLAWTGCTADDACALQRQQSAQAILQRAGASAHVVTVPSEFKKALRAGDFSVLWLSGPADELSPSLVEEVRAAVLRGASLWVDGAPSTQLRSLQDVWGSYADQPVAAGAQLAIGSQVIALQGNAWALTAAEGGKAFISYASGQTAAIKTRYGRGNVLALGFDSLATGLTASAWTQWLNAQWLELTPAVAEPMLARSVVRLKTTVESTATAAQQVGLATVLTNGMQLKSASPAATQDGNRLNWALDLPPGVEKTVEAYLVLPSESVATTIESQLRKAGDAAVVDSWSKPVRTLAAAEAAANMRQALAALVNASAEQRQGLSTLLDQADSVLLKQQFGEAINALLQMQQKLRTLPAHETRAVALQSVAQWIGLVAAKWTPDGSSNPDWVLARVAGDAQSAAAGKAFGTSLQVSLSDAQGGPVAGKAILFTAPATGASGLFSNGQAQISVATNAQGLASSGPLTANQTAGAFAVIASAEFVPKSVSFSLINLDTATAVLRVQAVAGSGQSTRVGMPFASTLQVKVVNAQGAGVSGQMVSFTLPTSGASAVFAGGGLVAQVPTDASGVALSPALQANAVEGAFQVSARVPGAVDAAAFALENLSANAAALKLQVIAGDGQSATVGANFAAALQVKLTNAQGAAAAGRDVSFTLPTQLAGAAFVGGAKTLKVTTDAQGIAKTPLLTANQVAGAFDVVVTASGVPDALRIRLTNTAVVAAGGNEVSIATPTGTGTVKVSISGGGPTCRFTPGKTAVKKAEGWLPLFNVLLFPHGVLEYELSGCEVGGTMTVTTEWPHMLSINSYLKYGPTPTSRGRSLWYAPKNLKIQGKQVSYTIQDGALGDDDLLANGVIKDPGGVATQSGPLPDEQLITPVPTLNPVALGVLSVLVGLAWVGSQRRRRLLGAHSAAGNVRHAGVRR